MTRAAIYARMSTDKQSERSPADQEAECRRFAAARDWAVVDDLVVHEVGVSAASRHNRAGLLELMARVADWDVLLCWDFDRLARDSEDLGWIRNRLRAHRRTAYAASTGLEAFNVGAKVQGVIAEEYLVKLRADTHRGLRGRVGRGLAAGAPPYGYRTAEGADGGRRIIVEPTQAAVVVRIFGLYAEGEGVKAIAHRLNAEEAPPPRPRALRDRRASWSPNSIREMLRNPLYRGELTWNRSEWIKDHATGRRRRFERPESEWLRRRDEAWRVVPDDLWERVQARLTERGAKMRTYGGTRVPAPESAPRRHLLSGLLECAACGGSFHALYRGTFGCSWRRYRGPEVCPSALRVDGEELHARVLGAIADLVLSPDAVAYVVERAVALVAEELARRGGDADRERLRDLDRQVARLVEAAALAGDVPELAARLRVAAAQRDALRARVQAAPSFAGADEIRARVEARLADLRDALEDPDVGRRALGALLDGRRLAVAADPARGFRVDGILRLGLDARSTRGYRDGAPGCCDGMVAGRDLNPRRPGYGFAPAIRVPAKCQWVS